MKKSVRLLAALMAACVMMSGCGNNNETSVSVSAPLENSLEAEIAALEALNKTKYEVDENRGESIVSDVNFDNYTEITDSDNERVFYQIFVGSFSDSNNDGIGDLRGIINRFDYLNDGDIKSGESLGIEGIWLSPINVSPSYHKYDVTDYYNIDPKFGTLDDLKELVSLAHERGVKVIMDLVINHSSTQNEWFKQFKQAHIDKDPSSEYYDFYTWSDGTVTGRKFTKIPGADEYYECNFSNDMPELNYENEAVYEEMLKVAKFYLEEYDIDGFRFDAAKYIYFGENERSAEFWKRYMADLKAVKPDIYTVAEVWDSDSVTDKYEPALNCFDFTMSQAEGKIAATAMKGDVNKYVSYVGQYIDKVKALNPDAMIIPFIANHDTDRAAGFMQVTSGFAFTAANLYILGPGSPFIYYGEEIGMKGSRGGANTDANRRLAMLWGDGDTIKDPEGADYDSKLQKNGTVKEALKNEKSVYTYYKRLIMIRRANPEIALGDYTPLSFSDTKVSGFISTYEGKNVCVIHNTTGSAETIDLSAATDAKFSEITATAGVGNEETLLEGTLLTVPAQTSVVLR